MEILSKKIKGTNEPDSNAEKPFKRALIPLVFCNNCAKEKINVVNKIEITIPGTLKIKKPKKLKKL